MKTSRQQARRAQQTENRMEEEENQFSLVYVTSLEKLVWNKRGLSQRNTYFRIRTIPETILINLLHFSIWNPDCLCNVSEENLKLWLWKNSSILDRVLRMQLSVLLTTWNSVFVTLPLLSPEIWVRWSSWILWAVDSGAWFFLGCSLWLPHLMAANFFFHFSIFRVVFLMREKFNTIGDWNSSCFLKKTKRNI